MNIVLTSLLTRELDPMRGYKWPPDASILETWASSIKGAQPTVIADELRTAPSGVVLVQADDLEMVAYPSSGGPYFNRWAYAREWLSAIQDDLEWVWITDGSDVVMLREPWKRMEEGILYLGSEEQVVGCDWMTNPNHHPSPNEQWFVNNHPDHRLMNGGLVGGDVQTVLCFLDDIVFNWGDSGRPAMSDMAVFNMTAYLDWSGRITTGEFVHTTFGANVDNGKAWWKHK